VPHGHDPLPDSEALRVAQLDRREIAGLYAQSGQIAAGVAGQDLSGQRASVGQPDFERTASSHVGVGNDQALRVPDCASPIALSSILDMDEAAMDAFDHVRQLGVQFR
jgi:hypothetical protein